MKQKPFMRRFRSQYIAISTEITLLLILVLGLFPVGNLSLAGETGVPMTDRTGFSTDDNRESSASLHSNTNLDTTAVSRANLCTGCAIPKVVVANREFHKGTDCLCIGTESITIGEGVVIRNGARVVFEAPKVHIQNSFKAEKGSIVIIQWDVPPPPPS